jgi:hypothetical protein
VNHDAYSDEYLRDILAACRTVAIVGASANTVRPSYFVLTYLLSKGYDVVAVNPGHAGRAIAGAPTVANLAAIGRPVDLIDIFRNSTDAAKVVDEALALEPLPRAIWMQLGVRNDAAAAKAEAAGVRVVMNRCPKIEYARLAGEIGWAGVNSGMLTARRPALTAGFQRFGIGGKAG